MRTPPLEIRELVVEARVTSHDPAHASSSGEGAARKMLAALAAGGGDQDRLVNTIVQLVIKRLRDEREV